MKTAKNFGCTLVTAWRRRMRRGNWAEHWSSRLPNFLLLSSSFAPDPLQSLVWSLEVLFPGLLCWRFPLSLASTSLSSLEDSLPWVTLLHILFKEESPPIGLCCFLIWSWKKSLCGFLTNHRVLSGRVAGNASPVFFFLSPPPRLWLKKVRAALSLSAVVHMVALDHSRHPPSIQYSCPPQLSLKQVFSSLGKAS